MAPSLRSGKTKWTERLRWDSNIVQTHYNCVADLRDFQKYDSSAKLSSAMWTSFHITVKAIVMFYKRFEIQEYIVINDEQNIDWQ